MIFTSNIVIYRSKIHNIARGSQPWVEPEHDTDLVDWRGIMERFLDEDHPGHPRGHADSELPRASYGHGATRPLASYLSKRPSYQSFITNYPSLSLVLLVTPCLLFLPHLPRILTLPPFSNAALETYKRKTMKDPVAVFTVQAEEAGETADV